MRKNHKIKAALFAGLAGTMLFGSCMTAYAAGVTKTNGKLTTIRQTVPWPPA